MSSQFQLNVKPASESHLYKGYHVHLEYVPSTQVWSWKATKKVEVSYTGTGKDARTALNNARRFIDGR